MPSDTVYTLLGSSPEGLTTDDATRRLVQYGRNTLREERATSLVVKFAANFTHLMALLLWIGGVIGFVARMPQLGIAILDRQPHQRLVQFCRNTKPRQPLPRYDDCCQRTRG